MKKILVVKDGVIVGVRERTKEELINLVLNGAYPFCDPDTIEVNEEVADLIEATLASVHDGLDALGNVISDIVDYIPVKMSQVFNEGVEAERDRAKVEEELGEEVSLVNPYEKVGEK